MKVKFNSDGNLPLNNILKLYNLTIAVRSVFSRGKKVLSIGFLRSFCHYWYFLDKGFKFEPYVYNGCHDLMQNVMNFKFC